MVFVPLIGIYMYLSYDLWVLYIHIILIAFVVSRIYDFDYYFGLKWNR
jgi:hypothetical protein